MRKKKDTPDSAPPKKPRAAGKKATAKPKPAGDHFIVGIGASAGGLEALELFLKNAAAVGNASFVVIQHLSPHHKSNLDEILRRCTGMEVRVIEDGMRLEKNRLYIGPPRTSVGILNRRFQTLEHTEDEQVYFPIDYFFRALAEEQGALAVGVVLSGTGTDGTLGVKSIKGHGGVTFVQEIQQAKFPGMPASAVDTGMIDWVLPAEKIPLEIAKYMEHPFYYRHDRTAGGGDEIRKHIDKILFLIMEKTGHDFSGYKPNTVCRRIEKRMAIHHLESFGDYIKLLRHDGAEIEGLFREMLIEVTDFFRDPDTFNYLRDRVLPDLLRNREAGPPFRLWVADCSTGEEAYSLAILIADIMDRLQLQFGVQIFASDINDEVITAARAARYPENISTAVDPVYLKRYFIKNDSGYMVKKQIRDMVVFAEHNLIRDPPYSKMDLITCRNLLIYLDGALQKRVIPMFHYSLNENGILVLGSSESIGEFSDLFSPVSAKQKVFKKRGGPAETMLYRRLPSAGANPAPFSLSREKAKAVPEVRGMVEKLIMESYAPAAVLINERHEILYSMGDTGMFLALPGGEPSLNVLGMARGEIRFKLGSLLHRAAGKKTSQRSDEIPIKTGPREITTVNIVIHPLPERDFYLIIFERAGRTNEPAAVRGKGKGAAGKKRDPRYDAMELELQSMREQLQSTLEEYESSNQEFRSTNEELQSLNEELQSTIEELETSKEEVQSTNEELITLNSELRSKVDELLSANNDINNLLAATDVGIIFLDRRLAVKRFSPAMTSIFNLIPADVGRPIGDITLNVDYRTLSGDCRGVLESLERKEVELRDRSGACYTMTILPYRTVDNIIDGVVITFMDTTTLKNYEAELTAARVLAENIVDAIERPLIVLKPNLRIQQANRAFHAAFGTASAGIRNKLIYEINQREWDIPELRRLLEEIVPLNSTIKRYRVVGGQSGPGDGALYIDAKKITRSDGETDLILLTMEREEATGTKI